ncbi:MAG: ABC transporter ATP-binding protein [Candidatus Latescibacteria bacterium]|nr:ABC transporter ATP-binding protein [Candidatus Latescibacterota bacterium]
MRPHRRRVALLALFIFGYIGVRLAFPQIARFFIDTALDDGPLESLMWAAAFYLIVGVGRQFFFLGSSYLGQDVGWRTTNRMRDELAKHCLHLDMGFHSAHTPGELVERVDGDTTALSNFLSSFAGRVIGAFLLLLGVLGFVWREDWRVGLALSLFALVAFMVINLTRSMAVPIYAAEREGYSRLYGFLEERLAGIEDIRVNGAVGFILERFFQVNRDTYGRVMKSALMGAVLRSITTVLFTFGHAMTMGMGYWLYQEGQFTIGTVYLVFEYTTLLRFPLYQISEQINDLQRATAGFKRIEALHRIQSRVVGGDSHISDGPLDVDFDTVDFDYFAGSPVLRDVNFRLEAGQTLGLLGRTGSGKTTLTRLLFRFYDVHEGGQIRLGGQRLQDASLESLRQRVGMVTQDVQIFRATVRENLSLFDEEIDDTRILSAIDTLALGEWYRTLSQGLDTPIAAGSLSAGESQLIAFARVFLKDPGLVILDEPSSRLDPLTERRIDRAVSGLLQGRTAIIIAHHLATVQRVDDILILEEGRVLEHGRREQLTQDPASHFARLLGVGLEDHTA